MNKNRFLSLLLCTAMVFTLLPAQALAAVDIQADAPALTVNTSIVGFAGQEWYVIGYDGNGVYSQNDTATLLLKDNGYGNMAFRTGSSTQDDPSWKRCTDNQWYYEGDFTNGPSDYSDSTLQRKMVAIANEFSDKELALINERTLFYDLNESYPIYPEARNQKLWALSYDEYLAIRDNTVQSFVNFFWLRSPEDDFRAFIGSKDGKTCYSSDVTGPVFDFLAITARPSFNLNMSSVLFTSAAVGGKSTMTEGSHLAGAIAPTGAVKFTAKNASQTLDVTATKTQMTQSGPTLTFGYTNATAGANQYVSCVLLDDSNEVAYYGKLKDSSSNTSGDLSIPLTGVANGTYTLQIFSEEANGDNYTDFCSEPVTMTLEVTGGVGEVSDFDGTELDMTAPVLSAGSAERTEGAAAEVSFRSDEAGTYYWQIDGAAPASAAALANGGASSDTLINGVNTKEHTGLAEEAHTIYIAAKDAAGNVSNMLTISIPRYVQEQFTLAPGGTYYFDLSVQGILGWVDTVLPDTTLKWVPFTYAGTVYAYSLEASSSGVEGASESAVASDRSLFVADYNISNTVSWDELKADTDGDFIFGDDYSSGNVSYLMRTLSVGSSKVNFGDDERGTPETNEWDMILNKDGAFIKNWNSGYSWGQDTESGCPWRRALRSSKSTRLCYYYDASSRSRVLCFRPALEIMNPDTLGPDGLKTVTYDMGGNGTLGDGLLESATVVYTGDLTLPEISAANGFNYRGSSKRTLGWYDGSTFYEAGTVLDSLTSGTTLTAGYDGVVQEQFTLAPGGTYYFDLSVQGIPGTVNTVLPDTTLKWVPFTYAGTVYAYSLEASSSGVAVPSDRSLFVADYNISNTVSWDDLNTDGFIFDKAYRSGGVSYLMRTLSAGRVKVNSGDDERGTPETNEWDMILNKDGTFIKNWNEILSWGQDTESGYPWRRALRGLESARFWYDYDASSHDMSLGFRPALEILNPETLGSDGLKTVTYDMDGNGTLGDGLLESATVVFTGGLTLPEITEENSFNYTGSLAGPLGWYDGDTFYEAGAVLDSLASGTTLTAGVASTVFVESISVTATGGADSVQVGGTLQMLADVLPANTTDSSVTWTIEAGSGATINPSGLLTATAEDTVTVRATANDSSGVYGEKVITITAAPHTFVAVTNITDVPATATVVTPLLLTGTIAPANATNQTIVWSIQDAGTAGATISGNTLFTAASGTVIVRATVINGASESTNYTQDFNITVNAASVVDAMLSPDDISFDLYTSVDDLETAITWNDATGITDVKIGGVSIGAGSYAVSGDTLAIKKEYLAAQPTGSFELSVEFNAGTEAALTIHITDTTPPSISPAYRNYDLNNPQDVSTTITWNSADSVTDVVYSVSPDITLYALDADNFTVTDNDLTIANNFFTDIAVTTGDSLVFTINFDADATATLTVDVVDSYIPSDNANLSSLSVNGTPVSGFVPSDIEYDVELPYGSSSATVVAIADDINAGVGITQASSLPGTAIVAVTAEDGTTIKTYTINLTIGTTPPIRVTNITVTSTDGVSGVQVGGTMQMLADVLPTNATDKSVTWSIESGSGGTVDASGLLMATAEDTVTVRATANDGSGVYGEKVITITAASPTFVAVTNIIGVPATATVGTPLPLTGTVAPANATNQTIAWSIQDAGTTGATISGNTLSTAASGIVIVRATITNGAPESTNYTQDINITVTTAPITTYTVTASAGSGGVISPSGSVSVASGCNQTFTITPDSGYRINSVTVDGIGQGAAANYTFTNVTADHTINATFKRTNSGGGSSGGGSIPSAPTTPESMADVDVGNGSDTTLPVTIDEKSGSAGVDVGNNLMSGSRSTVVTVPSIPNVGTYTLGVPVQNLSTPVQQDKITFKTDNGNVTVPSNMLTGVLGISGSMAQISISQGDKKALPEEVKSAIGDRTLVQLTLSIDGKQTNWSNPAAPVTVSIPYTPTTEELLNPESITVLYIDGSGNVVSIPNGRYDATTGTVSFFTTHFSNYAVTYVHRTFSDLDSVEWARKAIEVMASKGIANGAGDGTTFSPTVNITRADFMVFLIKTLGLTAEFTENFDDVKPGAYYYNAIGVAKKLGIASGSGSNLFKPTESISRQDMMVLAARVLEKYQGLETAETNAVLERFTDRKEVAEYAAQSLATLIEAGITEGSGGRLTPRAYTTRAEVAAFLYKIYNKCPNAPVMTASTLTWPAGQRSV